VPTRIPSMKRKVGREGGTNSKSKKREGDPEKKRNSIIRIVSIFWQKGGWLVCKRGGILTEAVQ